MVIILVINRIMQNHDEIEWHERKQKLFAFDLHVNTVKTSESL